MQLDYLMSVLIHKEVNKLKRPTPAKSNNHKKITSSSVLQAQSQILKNLISTSGYLPHFVFNPKAAEHSLTKAFACKVVKRYPFNSDLYRKGENA